MTGLSGLLLLADSRLPAGGHVHSGGVEALVDRRLLRSLPDLVSFLDARIRTAGLCAAAATSAANLVAANLVAVSVHDGRPGPDGGRSGPLPADRWHEWDRAVDVRTPSPALREASRAQGSALLRTATLAWPGHPGPRSLAGLGRPHHPLVLGAASAAAGADPAQTAALAVHHLVGAAAGAAVRLLGLDPLRVAAAQAALAPLCERVVAEAVGLATRAVAAGDPDLLPADATPLPEILAELHHCAEVTLFAS